MSTLQDRVDAINDSYFASNPPTKLIMDNYNRMLLHVLPEQIQNLDTMFTDDNGVKCKYVFKDFTSHPQRFPNGNPIWPLHARRNKTDYACDHTCNLEIYRKFPEDKDFVLEHVRHDFPLWSEPMMPGSAICPLSRVPKHLPPGVQRKWNDVDEEGNVIAFEDRDYSMEAVQSWASVDEDPNIPLGAFICGGQRKAVTTQEGVALNRSFRVVDSKLQTYEFKQGGDMVVDMRSSGPNHAISHVKVVFAKKVLPEVAKVNGEKIKHIYYVSCISMPSLNSGIMNVINAIRLAFYFNYDVRGTLNTAIDHFNSYFDMATGLSQIDDVNGVSYYKHYTIEDAMMVGNDSELLKLYARSTVKPGGKYRREGGRDIQLDPTDEEIQQLKSIFNAQFFPHIPSDNLNSKFTVLMDMVVDSIKFKFGYVSLSNKDHYGVKYLKDPSTLILVQDLEFVNFYLVSKLREKPPLVSTLEDGGDGTSMVARRNTASRKKSKANSFNELIRSITNKMNKITLEIHKNYIVGKWGLPSKLKQNTNIIQVINQTTISNIINTIRRIGVNVDKNASPEKSRQLDPSQYGYVDPTDTPDSDSGHVKQMANTLKITTEESDLFLIELIQDTFDLLEQRDLKEDGTPDYDQVGVYVNGNFLGYVTDAEEMEKQLMLMRRKHTISPYTSIYLRPDLDSHENIRRLIINTAAGRAIRPLFVIENDREPAFLKIEPPTNNFDELVAKGAIVYIDPSELEWRRVAVKLSDLTTGAGYDLMEMDPQNIFGVVASMMHLANFNSMPRIAYNANMMKQFASTVNMAFHGDFETGNKVLRYGQKSFVETAMGNALKQQEQPSEQNAVVAVMTHNFAVEDALVIKASALQRGLITSDSYDVVGFDVDPKLGERIGGKKSGLTEGLVPSRHRGTYTYKKNVVELGSEAEPIGDEEREEIYKQLKREKDPIRIKRLLDKTRNRNKVIGVATYRAETSEGTQQEYELHKGDVIGCKTVDGKEKCVTMHGLKGVVDRVWINHNPAKGKTHYRIRLRSVNINGNWKDIGDKLFGGHSQKGVIGLVVPDEDMPFTPDGISPDIIFNPHGFPSRVTMGYQMDALFGLSASAQDVNSAREIEAIVLPQENLYGHPILFPKREDVQDVPETIKYSNLDTKQQKALGYILKAKKGVDSNAIAVYLEEGNDFTLPHWLKEATYPNGIKTIGDLNEKGIWYRLAYEAMNGNLPRSSNYKRSVFSGTPYRGELVEENEREENIAIAQLKAKGWLPTGQTTMIDGKTGRMIGRYKYVDPLTGIQKEDSNWSDEDDEDRAREEAPETFQFFPTPISVGILSYKPLKHVVKEKIRYRDVGANSFLTRQAMKGKSKDGGIRYGEQETQIIFAHGASSFLQDRLYLSTDPSTFVSCSKCYSTAFLDRKVNQYRCTACGDAAEFVQLEAPRSSDLLKVYLNAMGLKSIFRYGNTEDSVNVTRRLMGREEKK